MRGTRPKRPDSLLAVALAVLLVLPAAAGVTGIGEAHEGTDHISREGDDIVVRLGDQHDVQQAKQVTVAVEGGKTVASPKEKNATDTFRIPVSDLSQPKRNLKNTNLTVTAKNETLFTERANLRLLTFGDGASSFADDGTLHVPLTRAMGYADGTPVTAKLDGKKTVNATVEHTGNGASLVVSFIPDKLDLPFSEQATIRVPGRAKTNVPLRETVRDETAVTEVGGQTLVVTNPLLTANASYDLGVRTEQPPGQFTSAVTTNGTGALAVSNPALADAGGLTVSVYRDGEPLFEGYAPSSTTQEPIRASVNQDGTGVNLSEPLPEGNVTVWITNGPESTNDSQYVQVTVPVTENGSFLDLRSTGYRLVDNGSYRLVVTHPEFARVNVSGSGNATNAILRSSGGSSTPDDSNGPLGFLGVKSTNLQFLLGGSLVLGVLLLGVALVAFAFGSGRESTPAGGSAASGNDELTLTVIVNDAGTNTRLGDDATVTASQIGGSRTKSPTEITDGKGTLELEPIDWKVTVESNGLTDQQRVQMRGNATRTFELGPRKATVTVSDDDGEPLSNVRVTCTPDGAPSNTGQTDSRGRIAAGVPVGANEVELSADHEKYEGDETAVTFDGDATAEASLTLRRLAGDLRVTATVDGTPVSGVRVAVTPREEAVRQLGEQERAVTTDETGVAAFDGLLAGRYEIEMEAPGNGNVLRTTSKRLRVRDGAVTSESLDATFEYSLGASTRDRISDIRRDVESLGSVSGRDVAIPRYYGTVVTDLLETVERIPDEGHQFVTVDADPDEVVTALLDTADETVKLVSNAMTTKRNTDLFGACVDMPDQRVEWTGRFDSDALFELLGEDRKTQRQTVLQQLRKVDDRIDAERSELAVVEPAREPWERTQEFVNSERGENLIRGAAVAFVAEGLLDAVDELFDHEELRERLERTVF